MTEELFQEARARKGKYPFTPSLHKHYSYDVPGSLLVESAVTTFF